MCCIARCRYVCATGLSPQGTPQPIEGCPGAVAHVDLQIPRAIYFSNYSIRAPQAAVKLRRGGTQVGWYRLTGHHPAPLATTRSERGYINPKGLVCRIPTNRKIRDNHSDSCMRAQVFVSQLAHFAKKWTCLLRNVLRILNRGI